MLFYINKKFALLAGILAGIFLLFNRMVNKLLKGQNNEAKWLESL